MKRLLVFATVLAFSPAFAQLAPRNNATDDMTVRRTLNVDAVTGTGTSGLTVTSSAAATAGTDTGFKFKTTNALSTTVDDSLVDMDSGSSNVYKFYSSGRAMFTSPATNQGVGFYFRAGTSGGKLLLRLSGGSGEIVDFSSDSGTITTWSIGQCYATNCTMALGPNAGGTPELMFYKGTNGPSALFNVKVKYDATDSSGTPGAITINKPAGKAAVAAGASSVVVTNSLVATTSIVYPVLQTNDATCTEVKSAIPASGSVTITLNGNCTAAATVGFVVYN